MKLDSNDIKVLNALLSDGRASLREVAKETSLSTPTVSNRLSRMIKAGLIRNFIPVLNPEAMNNTIVALVAARAPASKINAVAKKLATLSEVAGVYITTGENNITLKVTSRSMQELQLFLSKKLPSYEVEAVASQIITEAVKDEQPVVLASGMAIDLKCDLCNGPIAINRPYSIKVGPSYSYFCCKTCRKSYLERYSIKIQKLKTRMHATKTS